MGVSARGIGAARLSGGAVKQVLANGRSAVASASAVLARRGHGGLGALVALREADAILATPPWRGLEEVRPDDVVVVDGASAPDRTWPHLGLACAVLRELPATQAVVVTAAIHAVACSVRRLPVSVLSHEGCHLIPPPLVAVDAEDEAAVLQALRAAPVCLLSGMGLLSTGADLGAAVALAEYLERTCAMNLLASELAPSPSDDALLAKRAGQRARPAISWAYLERSTALPSGWRTRRVAGIR